MKIFFKGFGLFFFISLLQSVSYSQYYNFSNYSVANGLVQSTINSITQDKFGYIWLATNGGLSQFNGQSFKNFTKDNGIPSNKVNCLIEFENNLWVGTEKGLVLYDGKLFKKFKSDSFINSEEIIAFKIYKNNLLVLTDKTVNIISNKTILTIKAEEIGINSRITCITNDKDNNLWLGTQREGIIILLDSKSSLFDKEFIKNNLVGNIQLNKMRLEVITLNAENGLLGNNINCISEDLKHNIWYNEYRTGMGKISFDNDMKVYFSDYSVNENNENLFATPRIESIFCDKTGKIWLATDGFGVYKIMPKNNSLEYELSEKYIHLYSQSNGLPDNNPYCFFIDKENNMWLGTAGNGIVKLNNEKFFSYGKINGLEEERVISIFADDLENELWIGTYGGGVYHKKNELFTHYFWDDGLSESIVTGIVEDKFKNVWMSTNGGGISILPFENRNKKGKKFAYINTDNGLSWEFVSCITIDQENNIWAGLKNGGGVVKIINNTSNSNYKIENICQQEEILQADINSIFIDQQNKVWVATKKGVIAISTSGSIYGRYEKEGFLKEKEVSSICQDAIGNIWLGSIEDGIIILKNASKKSYLSGSDAYKPEYLSTKNGLSSNSIKGLIAKQDLVIATTNMGFTKITFRENKHGIKSIKKFSDIDGFSAIECNQNSLAIDKTNIIWLGSSKGLTAFVSNNDIKNNDPPFLNLEKILIDYQPIDSFQNKGSGISFSLLTDWFGLPKNLTLDHNKNNVTFEYSGISTSSSDQVKYQYILEGIDKTWSPITFDNKVTYPGLPHGSYTFKLKAGSSENVWSSIPLTYSFDIKPPYYKTTKFYIFSILGIIGLITLYIQLRVKNLRVAKKQLEEKVTERTIEVEKQKKEIVEKSKIIEFKNNDITAGIRYAERIQKAILPDEKLLSNYFSDYFIFFKPRDIVSGDFYWMAERDNKIYVAAIDCTGHGVSGAFMSLISYSLMNEALLLSNGENDQVLSILRSNLHKALKQNDSDSQISDGLDIALISYNREKLELEFSNSNRPLYILRNKELIIIDSTRSVIGGNYQSQDENFKTEKIKMISGDKVFLFTDGYTDQFGGEKLKKFGKINFQNFIKETAYFNMEKSMVLIENKLCDWQKNTDQIDDILVIGLGV